MESGETDPERVGGVGFSAPEARGSTLEVGRRLPSLSGPWLVESLGIGAGQVDRESSPDTFCFEVVMQGGVVPRQTVDLGELLEPADEPFRDLLAGMLIRGVAEINTAAERARIACRAAPCLILPGARFAPIERAVRWGCLIEEEPDFGGRNEERVSVLLEPAAAAGELTNRTETSHLPIELCVQSDDFGAPCGNGARPGRITWR